MEKQGEIYLHFPPTSQTFTSLLTFCLTVLLNKIEMLYIKSKNLLTTVTI